MLSYVSIDLYVHLTLHILMRMKTVYLIDHQFPNFTEKKTVLILMTSSYYEKLSQSMCDLVSNGALSRFFLCT